MRIQFTCKKGICEVCAIKVVEGKENLCEITEKETKKFGNYIEK